MKWRTYTEFVDIDTGEIIYQSKERILKNYQVINKNKKTEFKKIGYEEYGIVTYTNECRRKPKQLNIF